jgi:hypothetical protein
VLCSKPFGLFSTAPWFSLTRGDCYEAVFFRLIIDSDWKREENAAISSEISLEGTV